MIRDRIAKSALDARRQDTREKIELGGLVVKAGLRGADRAVVLGVLIDGAERAADQDEYERLRRIGAHALGGQA